VLFTLLGRLAQFVIVFASVKIMTHLLSPTEMGKVALITTITSLFAMFLVNPVGMFINRRLHTWIEDGSFRGKFHLFSAYIGSVGVAAALLLTVAFQCGLDLGGASLRSVILLVCGSLVFNTAVQTLVPSLNMVQRTRPFVILTVGTLLSSLGASVALSETAPPSAERWLAGTLVGQAIFAAIAYAIWFRRRPMAGTALPLVASAQIRRLLSFCWPIAIAVLLQWLHLQGYRFWLAKDFGLDRLGIYAAGYGVAASLMSAFETILTTWFQPVFYRMANSPEATVRDRAWSTYATMMVPASILGVSAVIAASPALPQIFLGPAFHDAGLFVMLGAATEWGRMMMGIVSLNAHRHMSTRQLIVPSLLGVIVTYAGLLIGLPIFGMPTAPLLVFAGACVTMAYICLITFRNDPHMTLAWRPTAALAIVLAIATAAAVAIQYWLNKVAAPVWPPLTCGLVGLLWLLMARPLRRQLSVLSGTSIQSAAP
jgi:O-antigen/teichoic acid export membrane protein